MNRVPTVAVPHDRSICGRPTSRLKSRRRKPGEFRMEVGMVGIIQIRQSPQTANISAGNWRRKDRSDAVSGGKRAWDIAAFGSLDPEVGAVLYIQEAVDLSQIILDRAVRDVELTGDLFV